MRVRCWLVGLLLLLTLPLMAQPTPDDIRRMDKPAQRTDQNQKILRAWVGKLYRGQMSGLDHLQCHGSLFSLGNPALFDAVFNGLNLTHADSQRILFAPGNPHTLPREGPIFFSSDARPDARQVWHELQHILCFRAFTGEGHHAATLDSSTGAGKQFYNSLMVSGGNRDDEGHHVFIEGYGERGFHAYEKLTNFERTLKTQAEQEYKAVQNGASTLSNAERDALYAPAAIYYQEFLDEWAKVAPFDTFPQTATLRAEYTRATGIFFLPPADVERFYRDGHFVLKTQGGDFAVRVPASVFNGTSSLVAGTSFLIQTGTVNLQGDTFSQACELHLRRSKDGRASEFTEAGPWGQVEFKLENPEENYTSIKVSQNGSPVEGVALAGGSRSSHLVRTEGKGRSVYLLTFQHRAVSKCRQDTPFKVRVSYHDTRRPAQAAPTQTLVMFQLPARQSATLTVTGGADAAQNEELNLKVEARFTVLPPPAVTFRWQDVATDKVLSNKDTLRFSSSQPGDHRLRIAALTADGSVVGTTEHVVSVHALPQLVIQGPDRVLATDVFTLKSEAPPELQKQSLKFRWYRVKGTQREQLYRLTGLVGVPELADPMPPSQNSAAAEGREVRLQFGGGETSNTYLVEALDAAGKPVATSKPFTVQAKTAYFETDVPPKWEKKDSVAGSDISLQSPPPTTPKDPNTRSGSTAEGLPGIEFECRVALKWNPSPQPQQEDGSSKPGLAGFKSRGPNRQVKGKAGFTVDVTFSPAPGSAKGKAAYDSWRKTAQAQVDTMLARLRIVDRSSDQQARKVKVRLETQPNVVDLKAGQQVEVRAVLEGEEPADRPLAYRWQGEHEGEGSTVRFVATLPGKHTLKVAVSGARGYLGEAEVAFQLKGARVILERTTQGSITAGMSAPLKATVEPQQKVVYRWQPHPEVQFRSGPTPLDPPETTGNTADAHFTTPGTFSIWVEALDPKTGKTLGESDPLEVKVGPPQLSIQLDPPNPLVGQTTNARLVLPKGLEEAEVRWMLPNQLKALLQSPDTLQMSLYSMVTDTVDLSALVLVGGEELGTAKVTVQARPYQVTAVKASPKGTVETGARVELVASISPQPEGKVNYRWRVDKDSSFLSTELGTEVAVSRHEVGSLEAYVVATDARDVVLGQGRLTVPITTAPWLGLAQKARQSAEQGKFSEAASAAEEVSRLDPKAGAALKEEVAEKIALAGLNSIDQEHFQEAMDRFQLARKLNPSDPRYPRESKRAAEFLSRYQTVDRLMVDLQKLVENRRYPSAQQKLYEISQVENAVPRLPKGNYRLAEAQKLFNWLNEEYNKYWSAVQQERMRRFKAKDYGGLIDLCQVALREWEHTPANEEDLRGAIRDYSRLLDDPVSQAYTQAKRQLDAHNYEQAVQSATQVIQSDPARDRGGAFLVRARARYVLSEHDGFISDSKELLKYRPKDPEALALMGMALIYEQVGKEPTQRVPGYLEAARLYRKAAELSDGSSRKDYLTDAAYAEKKAREAKAEAARPVASTAPVARPLKMSLNQSQALVQKGQSVSIRMQPEGGTPPYSYSWYVGGRRSQVTGQGVKITPTGDCILVGVVVDSAGNKVQAQCSLSVKVVAKAESPKPASNQSVRGDSEPLTPGWDDSSQPLASGVVQWMAKPAGNGRLEVEFDFVLRGAKPNHTYGAGAHFFVAQGVEATGVSAFGGRMLGANLETITRDGVRATLNGAYDFGAIQTDGQGNGRAHFRYLVPDRRYAVQFTVRRGTGCPGQSSDCAVVYRSGGRFAGRFTVFGSKR